MSFKYFMFLAVTSIVLNGSDVNTGPVNLTTNKAESDESEELAMEHGTSAKTTTEVEAATKHARDDKSTKKEIHRETSTEPNKHDQPPKNGTTSAKFEANSPFFCNTYTKICL